MGQQTGKVSDRQQALVSGANLYQFRRFDVLR